jgi:hypothetical protein
VVPHVRAELRPSGRPHQLLLVREVLGELLDDEARPAAELPGIAGQDGDAQVAKAPVEVAMRAVERAMPGGQEGHLHLHIKLDDAWTRISQAPPGAAPSG